MIDDQVFDQNEKEIEKRERQYEGDEIRYQDERLHPWVAEELDDMEEKEDIFIGEDFNIPLGREQEYIIRWNPQSRSLFRMEVYVLAVD